MLAECKELRATTFGRSTVPWNIRGKELTKQSLEIKIITFIYQNLKLFLRESLIV